MLLLHADGGLPARDGPSVSIATDDMIAYERRIGSKIMPGSVSPLRGAIDSVWAKLGIVGKDAQRRDRVTSWDSLGLIFVKGIFLVPKAARLHRLVLFLTYLLTRQKRM